MTQGQRKTFAGRKFAFTGGGSAGHVVPLLPLMEDASDHGAEVRYMGSMAGIEKSIIGATGIPYIALHTTKLRRSFSISNLAIPWLLIVGIRDAIRFFSLSKGAAAPPTSQLDDAIALPRCCACAVSTAVNSRRRISPSVLR